MELERIDLFSVPVWRTRLPEFEPHAATVEKWVLQEWKRGTFKRHAHGYGYQTPSTLFSPQTLSRAPELQVLKKAFREHVRAILAQRVNHTVHLPPETYAFMAWVLVQTNEEWVSGTWHDHFPATLSACYYLKMPETEGAEEGALAFQRPCTPDTFVKQVQSIKPRQGDFILFPSNLIHRPQPCPSADGLRISINMDAYVHWTHWNEEDKPPADSESYQRRLKESLDPGSGSQSGG